MTRLIGSPEHAGSAIYKLFHQFKWHHVSWLFHNHNENAGRGNSVCSFTLSAIQRHFSNKVAKQTVFDETESTRADFRKILLEFQKVSRSECLVKASVLGLLNIYDHDISTCNTMKT